LVDQDRAAGEVDAQLQAEPVGADDPAQGQPGDQRELTSEPFHGDFLVFDGGPRRQRGAGRASLERKWRNPGRGPPSFLSSGPWRYTQPRGLISPSPRPCPWKSRAR